MALKSTPVPLDVRLLDAGRRIRIDWQDGRTTEHEAFALRAACLCARCVDEVTGKRRLDPASLDPGLAATGWTQVGRYALQFAWSDGHTTGIYPFERLREGWGRIPENEAGS
jgi:DUF971 family protein